LWRGPVFSGVALCMVYGKWFVVCGVWFGVMILACGMVRVAGGVMFGDVVWRVECIV
jgi:hypothetical protein